MKSKKIAFVGIKGIPASFQGMGGIDLATEKISQLLVKKGYQVKVFVRYWATPKHLKVYKGIKLIHLPTIHTKNTDTFVHSLLATLYTCFSQDKVIFFRAVGSAFLCFLPKLFGKKVITTIHGEDWKRDKWGIFAKIFLKISERIALNVSHKVVVVSRGLQKKYAQLGQKTIFIPNGYEKKAKAHSKIIKKEYGLKGDDYILYLGRFVPEKRIEWLIKAFKKANFSTQKLILAGGASHTDSYVKKLKKLAGKDKKIIFTGYVFGQRKSELLSNCSLFVLPSNLEGLSNSLIEAMQFERLVLAADISANQELITNKKFLFRKDNFNDFFGKLIFLLKAKPSFKHKMCVLTWNEVSQEYIKLLEDIS